MPEIQKKKLGGARPGAGRPKGSQSKSTLERKAIEEELKQRVLKNIDPLINAQLSLARGVAKVFKTVTTPKTKELKHVIVTNENEIKKFLDTFKGENGVIGDSYYYITIEKPDGHAIDSLLDRVFGKARQNIGLDGGEDDKPVEVVIYGEKDRLKDLLIE